MPNYANMNDLKSFLKSYRPDMSSSTGFSITSVDNGNNFDQNVVDAGMEADLDIQYTIGLATGVPVDFITIGTDNQDGDDGGCLDVINKLISETSPPLVVTTSYGFEQESSLSKDLSIALCNSYMQLTARGVSILFASGDGGVAASPNVTCSSQFAATFPTCPYVTLVGATQGVPESGAWFSAGGFSNYFPTAKWQHSSVNQYLAQLGSEYEGMYNKAGRAYPDVSAQGSNVQIYLDGIVQAIDGTSASSPIFASLIALINADLLHAGRKPLGFLNPWMYYNSWAFNDITTGSNPGCGTNGFPALKGWDPVTGLGSPNYAKLRSAAGLR
jgi:tripeptidyl-peptidase-1